MNKHFLALFIGIVFGVLTFSIMQLLSASHTENQLKKTDNLNKIYWSVFSIVIGFSISEFISTKLED